MLARRAAGEAGFTTELVSDDLWNPLAPRIVDGTIHVLADREGEVVLGRTILTE